MSSSAYRSGLLARMAIGLLVSALAALGLPLVTAAPASASVGTGVVLGGTVTDSLAAPLSGVMVEITRTDGTWVDTVMTAADGTWQEPPLSGGPLAAGSFFVHVYGGDRPDIWYPNATSSSGAVAVTLADGQSNTGLDVSLPDGHAISGTVTVTGGASPAGVTVVAQSNGGLYSSPSTTVAADGTYHLAGLADGDWTLTFVGSASVNVVSTQYAGGAAVTIAGASRTGIDQVLTPGAAISGTITRPGAAAGSAPSTPTVYDAVTGNPIYGLSATSGTDGSYSVFDLPAGSVKVLFTENGYAFQWWNAQTSQAAADAVALVEGGVATGVDASLTVEHSISGTVTDAHGTALAGATVTASDGTPEYSQYGWSAADGTFSLSGLRTGTYTVTASPTDDLHLAVSQSVAVGSTDVPGVTLAMPDAGVVTGHVLRPDSSAVSNATVRLQDYDATYGNWLDEGQVTAGFDGSFRLGSLVPGTDYRLVTHDVTGEAIDATSATFAAVAGPQVQDIVMSAGGAISGTVTGTGGAALGGVSVSATNGTDYFSSTTDGLGHYTIGGLPTGSYDVTFSDQPAYLDGYATGVAVTAPGTTTLDRTLTAGATISGTVVDGHGQPVAGVRVGVGPAGSVITCYSANEALTAADGSFTVPGLVAGSYDVAFGFPGCDRLDANVVGEYWQDVSPGQTPTPVTLVAGQTVSLAAHVTRYSVLSGTVSRGGVAIADAQVSAWAVGASSPATTVSADATGAFSLSVPAGDYKLQVTSYTSPPFWYSLTPDRVLATVVSVSTETDQSGLSLAAPFTGAIGGQVTSGGNPFTAGGTVEVRDNRDRFVGWTSIDASGGYRIDGLPTGQYRLLTYGNRSAEVWVGGTSFETATVQPVVDGATTTVDIAIPGAALFGTITPTVSAGGNTVMSDLKVFDAATGDFVNDCWTDPQYGCSGITLPVGSYKLLASSITPGYADTWYGGTSLTTATVVSVTAGTTTPVSLALQPGGSVAVTVTNDTAVLLSPVSITVSPASGGPASATFGDSIGSGSSVLETSPSLIPGTYRVTASHDAEVTTTTVVVTAGATTPVALSLVSAAASETTGSITGLVQDGTGAGVAGVSVCGWGYYCGVTGSDGSYTISGVPAGVWSLGVSSLPAGTAVDGPLPWVVMAPLTSTTSVAPVITLVSSATASGHVTLPGGGAASDAHVGIFEGDRLAGETYTGATGAWSVAGLAAGSYTVEADSGSDAFEQVWYPSSATQSGATPVSLAAGATRTGLDLALIAGKTPARVTLTSSSASGVGSTVTLTATVVSADTGGATPTGTVQFGFDGTAVGTPVALVNGVASVDVVTTQSQSSATVEYGGDSTYGRATGSTSVLATATMTVTSLAGGSSMATAGAALTFDLSVSNFDAGTTPTGWVTLHADDGTELATVPLVGGAATATIHSLYAGPHTVWAEYHGDSTHQPSSSGSMSIDVTGPWPPPGGIGGTVTSGPSAPIPGLTVDLFSAATGNAFVRETTTAADGTYTFGGLTAGSYLVRFSGATITTTWWQGQSSIGSATPVAVIDGATATVSPVLSAVAAPTGSLSGTVTAASGGAPVANAWVQLCATTGPAWCATTQTDAAGAYALDGLADATYHLLIQPWGVGLNQADASVVVSGGAAVTHDVALTALVVPPPSVSVTTTDGVTQDNVPIATWSDSIPVAYAACAAGTGTYTVTDSTGATVKTGSLTEGPSGTYTGTIPPLSPVSGMLTVTASVACPSGPPDSAAFNLYVDPSGQVVDTNGKPVSGATVTLAQFDALKAAYVAVPSGSTVMSPANRVNPDTTDANGHFGWDVQPGHYRVTATKTGCYLPGSPGTPAVSTGDLDIPPAVTDVQLVLECPPPPTAPSAPTAVSAVAGDGAASVSWTAPSSDGGSAVTGYTVTASPGAGSCAVAAPALSCTVSGLADGTAYTFTVTATNAVGTSVPSAPSAPVTPVAPPSPPNAPTGVTATAGDGSATVWWTAPASNGGPAITGYTVTASAGGGSCAVAAPALSCTVSGLANGTAYTFTVTATSSAGTSVPSAPSAPVTPVAPTPPPPPPPAATAPSAPSGVTATAGNASAVVSWASPPAGSDGGSPITAYTVTSSPGGATCSVAPPALSCRVTGLANATAYTFTVTASNAVGTSAASAPSAAVTTDGVAPTITVAALPIATLATSVRVSWKAADSGSGVAGYAVRYERAAWNSTRFAAWVYPSAWQHLTSPAVTLPVAAGFSYCVSVRARDRVGNLSAWSPIRCVARALDDRALVAGKGWVRGVGSAFYLHTATSTKALGAVLVRTGARLDRIGIVATRCKACGVVGIYVANRLIGKINLYLSVTRYKQVLFLPKFSYRYGTVVIRSLTARKLVQVDGLVVIRT